jgi:hypothetical protein
MGVLRNIYRKIIPGPYEELSNALIGCKTLLDVGCGNDSPIKYYTGKMYSVGIDAYMPSIITSSTNKIHNNYMCMNINMIGEKFYDKSFDYVLAFDLIEHLTKDESTDLINMMERIAIRKVIIFTPNGFVPQGKAFGNPFQEHKCGWTVDELTIRGYDVIGMNGLKSLRGENAMVKFWPKVFWSRISDITQLFVRKNPKYAFQIFCVKDMTK